MRISKEKHNEDFQLTMIIGRKLGDRDRPVSERFDCDPPAITLVAINCDGDEESVTLAFIAFSFNSNEPSVSTKRSRSKLSSSTPLPNHRPHGNLRSFLNLQTTKTKFQFN